MSDLARRILVFFSIFTILGCCTEEPPITNEASASQTAEQGPLFAILETEKGDITLELHTEDAPRLSANFVNLVQREFFNGLDFYRSSTVMRQTGNPWNTEAATYNPGYRLLPEFSPNLDFSKGGMVGCVLFADNNLADVRPTEFFLTVKPQDRWTFKYPIFGSISDGMEVVGSLQDGDLIRKIRLEGDPTPLLRQQADMVSDWNAKLDANPPGTRP